MSFDTLFKPNRPVQKCPNPDQASHSDRSVQSHLNKKRSDSVRFLCEVSIIAALYTVLNFVSSAMGLSSGLIQLRLSEVLCILPVFSVAAIPGLALGCFLSNLLTGCILLDVICGTLATLAGALGTYFFRKKRFLSSLFPILANTVVIAPVLVYGYGIATPLWLAGLYILIGEFLSAGLLGQFFYVPCRNLFLHLPSARKK